MDQDIVAPDAPPTLAFTATRGSFLKLLLLNALLTLLTLGVYRFWAKTKVRRYLWSHIRFLDDPLEYTGTAGELFLGFLIVLAVLFPLGFIYTTIQALVPPDRGWLHVALEVAYYMVLFALIQIGFYRAWRYRMSRTRWRGIRFGLDGSSWEYLRLASGWTVLTVLTLGIAYPWMQVELWRYQMRHTHIGRETFQFNGGGRDLLKPWLVVYIPVCISAALFGVFYHHVGFGDFGSYHVAISDAWVQREFTPYGIAIGILGLLVLPILLFRFAIQLHKFKIDGLRVEEGRITSSLHIDRLLGFGIMSAGLIAFSIIVVIFGPGAAIVGAYEWFGADASLIALAPTVLTLLVFLVLAPFAWTILYTFELVKRSVTLTDVSDPSKLERIAQRPASEMKTGEGLADALDIGGL